MYVLFARTTLKSLYRLIKLPWSCRILEHNEINMALEYRTLFRTRCMAWTDAATTHNPIHAVHTGLTETVSAWTRLIRAVPYIPSWTHWSPIAWYAHSPVWYWPKIDTRSKMYGPGPKYTLIKWPHLHSSFPHNGLKINSRFATFLKKHVWITHSWKWV